ncbi:molecular chaperone [Pseudomonas sp. PA-6-1D]|uniref:Molecular chaperone n=1 Tax=Pseudomonas edaphica TaxID=2006980 RepID=A0A7Y7RNN4_9PSED|nr:MULTISPECIES: p pilus assembly chaperone [Pseudomonas]MCF5144468.1 molecular chaperone [Pseudomonas sp. PA-6-3C]MCF5147822.1 molecular chaperone [Pseudomonas sp. PA-6-3F]MCF5161717.1 molecular chaperone [Pseudomonas sp. PA-6-2E]MCF5175526.1 molecular chaperone [Pseudomonas sp. PA-6-1D]MCF5190481.1 molecular chaperone [Pseudomonas sp. PA-6-1H]
MKHAVLSVGLWLVSLAVHAGPAINVGVVYDYLEGDRSSYLKRVYNGGTSTAFIKVNVLEIVYNADGTSREVPVASMTDAKGSTTNRDGLMASPARLIVPAGGRQGTRLLYMGQRDKERYFRVRFIPVVPEKEDDFAVTDAERAEYKDALAAGVNVMAGYGTVFFVRPQDTRFDTRISETASQYTMRNAGNSVVVLDEFRDCSVTKKTECEATTKHHILPGRQLVLEKKSERQFNFQLIEGRNKKTMTVNSNG